VLYEMLSGRSPLGNTKDKNARMQKQRFDNVPPMKPAEVKAPLAVFRLVETMMALNPVERYQTPQHLLKAIKDVRRELEGKPPEQAPTSGSQAGNVAANGRSIFVVEQHEKLQDAIRDKFKEVGFRVLMSADPSRALLRFQQQPYDALLIDAGTVGEDGLVAFRQILEESDRRRYPCAAVLLLAENQASWAERILPRARQAVLIRPVTLRQLYTKICELITQE